MAALVQIIVTPGSGAGRAVGIARDVRRLLEKEGYAARMQAFRTLAHLDPVDEDLSRHLFAISSRSAATRR